MPVNNISLLPEDLRDKEAAAREKASEAKAPPSFKMHVPTVESPKPVAPPAQTNQPVAAVSFGNGGKPEEKKGLFKIFKKPTPPIPPVVKPPQLPKPKLNPDMWLKYFDPGKGLLKKIKPQYLNTKSTTVEYNWVVNSEFWYKLRGLFLIILIILVVLFVGVLGIKSYHNGRLSTYNSLVLKSDRLNLERQNGEGYKDRASAIVAQAEVIKTVMSDKLSWMKLFNVLERNTVADVSYLDFQILNETTINLTVKAPSYTALAQQVALFERIDGVKLADLNEASVAIDKNTDEKEVTGDVRLTLNPEFWTK